MNDIILNYFSMLNFDKLSYSEIQLGFAVIYNFIIGRWAKNLRNIVRDINRLLECWQKGLLIFQTPSGSCRQL